MSLITYKQKRNFKNTPEPAAAKENTGRLRFVVQEHHATRLHFDFRLEMDGVLKSWAVPKGPSMDPATKRLAVMVEDHPVSYINFKGTIPKGNYGAGTVKIFDSGTYVPVNENHEPLTEKQALQWLKKGEIKVLLKGKKLKGEFVLVRLKDEKNWLLIKHKNEINKTVPVKQAPALKNRRFIKGKKIEHYIKPMLATAFNKPFDDKEWIYEIKWDGYRAIADLTKKTPQLYSRNGLLFNESYPAVKEALQQLKLNAVLDGEIVVLDDKGKPNFQLLQHYSGEENIAYYIFDMLQLKGRQLHHLPLIERKSILKKILPENDIIKYCAHIETKGKAFFKKAVGAGLEGIIAKKADSFYHKAIRSKEWLKIKGVHTEDVIIAGYTAAKGSRKGFGSLLLASYKKGRLVFRGHVGTGFNNEQLIAIKKILDKQAIKKTPFDKKIPLNDKATWVKPTMMVEIAHTETTKEGIFRHPAFVRLREEKKVVIEEKKIEKEDDATEDTFIKAGRYKVPVTNPKKIYWPVEGYTKQHLITYYENIAAYILPHLKNRPLSLYRSPNGINEKGFFHKDAGDNVPAFVNTKEIFSESGNKNIHYIICNNAATLLYLANLGCIEMNPWNSTIQKIEYPDYMVIDIDPSDKNDFNQVIETALAVKQVLDKAKVESYCKTSGATGLHIYVPLHKKYDYEHVKSFAEIVASLTQQMLPGFTTLERSLSKRGPNIYVDYLQNRRGQTLASAYSVRPKPGATVSTPLHWKEVKYGLHPSQFTIENIFKRLQKTGDIFNVINSKAADIKKALSLLSV
jgi:bifunctional non-homologous end joining protein LigD